MSSNNNRNKIFVIGIGLVVIMVLLFGKFFFISEKDNISILPQSNSNSKLSAQQPDVVSLASGTGSSNALKKDSANTSNSDNSLQSPTNESDSEFDNNDGNMEGDYTNFAKSKSHNSKDILLSSNERTPATSQEINQSKEIDQSKSQSLADRGFLGVPLAEAATPDTEAETISDGSSDQGTENPAQGTQVADARTTQDQTQQPGSTEEQPSIPGPIASIPTTPAGTGEGTGADAGHGADGTGAIPSTGTGESGPLVASIPTVPAETREGGTVAAGTAGQFFAEEDVENPDISAPLISDFPKIGEKDPGGSIASSASTVQTERADFMPDEIEERSDPECNAIALPSSSQFNPLTLEATGFYDNPAMHSLGFTFPFSAISGSLDEQRRLIIGVAIKRADIGASKVVILRWNSFPLEANPGSNLIFSIMIGRILFGTEPVTTRVMLWFNQDAICVDQNAYLKFSFDLPSGRGQEFPIPIGAGTATATISPSSETPTATINSGSTNNITEKTK